MENSPDKMINLETVRKLLMGQDEYIDEFANASIESFSDFSKNFAHTLPDRDLEGLKRTGHRIKPVAIMLEVEVIVEEYERAKQLLNEERPADELDASVEKVQALCDRIIGEFRQIIGQIDNNAKGAS